MQIGFLSLLSLLFIALKLTGYIMWSWWLVLLPMYGGVALFLVVFLCAAIATVLSLGLDTAVQRKRK